MGERQARLSDKQTALNISDLNGNFSGRSWFGHYYTPGLADEVLTTDPAIATGWQGLLSVMGQAAIDITGDHVRADVVEYLRACLFRRLNRRFNAVFNDVLQALVYGCQPLEVVTKYECGRWWLVDLVPIPARNFDLENVTRGPGEWWINGRCQTEHGYIKCGGPGEPGALVLWLTYGPGLFGRSIIRPILNEHLEKGQIRRLRAVGLAKSIIGTVTLFERKPDANQGEEALTDEQLKEQAECMAEALEAAEESTIALPNTFDKVQPIYPSADCVGKSIEAEDHTDLQILQAFGSQHLARGLLSGYGSQGAGETDTKAQQALRGLYFEWAASALQPLIDWLCDINFGALDSYPELSIISPTPQSPESLARSYVQLAAAGAIQPTKEDEILLRRLLRLPLEDGDNGQPTGRVVRVPGTYDAKTGIDSRDRTFEYRESDAEQ